MSGAANRRRGADAERAVVSFLRANGYPDARRYLAGDGRQPGDIDGVPGLCIEVKDVASSAWPTWCRQAEQQANGGAWVVVRRTRGTPDVGEWRCRYRVPGVLLGSSLAHSVAFGRFLACWHDDEAAP